MNTEQDNSPSWADRALDEGTRVYELETILYRLSRDSHSWQHLTPSLKAAVRSALDSVDPGQMAAIKLKFNKTTTTKQ